MILSGLVYHNKGKLEANIPDHDVLVYGHSHKYSFVEKDGKLWFNPGCCGKRKKEQDVTFAIAEINNGEISVIYGGHHEGYKEL